MAASTTDRAVDQPGQQELQPVASTPGQKTQKQAVKPVVSDKPALSVLTTAAKRLNLQSRLAPLHRYLQKLRSWVWFWIEDLLEEFQPWLKWIIYDAVLTLVIGQLVKHFDGLRPLFEAIGWA